MVIIIKAIQVKKCPFSKKLIKYKDLICQFDNKQFSAFKKIINNILNIFFPKDIIELIIEKTRYEKLLYKFGLVDYTLWINRDKKIKNLLLSLRQINLNNYFSDCDSDNNNDNDNDSDNNSDNDSDNDSDNE